MRRSQRLIRYKNVADKSKCFDESSNSFTDDRNVKNQIQNLDGKTDSGSNNKEISLPQLFKNISEEQSTDLNQNTLHNSSKTNAEVQEINTSNNNISKRSNLKSIKRAQNKR